MTDLLCLLLVLEGGEEGLEPVQLGVPHSLLVLVHDGPSLPLLGRPLVGLQLRPGLGPRAGGLVEGAARPCGAPPGVSGA